VILVWASSAVVSFVNAVPLLPKLMELIGLGYSSWFIYRYLLFKARRRARCVCLRCTYHRADFCTATGEPQGAR
jgi:hypothetical protein